MPVTVSREPPSGDRARALLAAMEAELTRVYGPLVVGDTPPARPEDLVAYVVVHEDDRPVAGGGLKRLDARTGEIKRMYTVHDARGRGHARVLLAELEAAARDLGFRRMRLDTGAEMPRARRMYLAAGYREIADYNDNRYAAFWGEKLLPVVVDAAHNGPPTSGHGGWSAAQAALLLDPGPAAVSLLRPPPLDTAMAASWEDGAAVVRHAGEPVLEARPATPQAEPPAFVEPERVHAVSPWPPWSVDHPFPTCFACGPGRPARDGLELFPGPLGDGRWVVPWIPAESSEELVWAALDCPSSAPVAEFEGERLPIVLARLCLELSALPAAGEPHVIVAAPGTIEGRKRTSAIALYAAAGGRPLAHGEALWIRLRG